MIGNVKRALDGTYHKLSEAHLPGYLAAFCYRFNRRFRLGDMLARLAYAAVRTPPMPLPGKVFSIFACIFTRGGLCSMFIA